MITEQEELLTIGDVMSRLKVGRTTVYSLMDSGKLRAVKLGFNRRILASDLDSYMASLPSPTDVDVSS